MGKYQVYSNLPSVVVTVITPPLPPKTFHLFIPQIFTECLLCTSELHLTFLIPEMEVIIASRPKVAVRVREMFCETLAAEQGLDKQ